MGWHPAREADGTVLPENLYFNQPQTLERIKQQGDSKVIKGRRASNGRGTPKNTLPSENKRPRERNVYATIMKGLAGNAMAIGWLNGQRLARKG